MSDLKTKTDEELVEIAQGLFQQGNERKYNLGLVFKEFAERYKGDYGQWIEKIGCCSIKSAYNYREFARWIDEGKGSLQDPRSYHTWLVQQYPQEEVDNDAEEEIQQGNGQDLTSKGNTEDECQKKILPGSVKFADGGEKGGENGSDSEEGAVSWSISEEELNGTHEDTYDTMSDKDWTPAGIYARKGTFYRKEVRPFQVEVGEESPLRQLLLEGSESCVYEDDGLLLLIDKETSEESSIIKGFFPADDNSVMDKLMKLTKEPFEFTAPLVYRFSIDNGEIEGCDHV